MPTHDVTIPQTSTSSTSKPYTLYHIAIRSPKSLRPTIIQKRYSEFEALHTLLQTQAGSAPPSPLPSKSWFSRTVNNSQLTESRRLGLQTYLQSIETSSDARWRNSPAYLSFLNLDTAPPSTPTSPGITRGGTISTASGWLDVYSKLKSTLQEARLHISARESAHTTSAQHESSASAKKALVQAGTLHSSLSSALDALSGKTQTPEQEAWGAERLGEGEIRRRRDLLSAALKEKGALEGVLAALAVRSAKASIQSALSSTTSSSAAHTDSSKSSLFSGASSKPGYGGRSLGGPPKETNRTRELDNEGVLQLQKQIMQEQDTDVTDLTSVIRRMKDMGIAINEELQAQSEMLEMLDEDVERVDAKIRVAKKRTEKIR